MTGSDSTSTTSHGGHGLTNLHDRVAAVGGDVHVASGHGAGTTVSGDVPTRT